MNFIIDPVTSTYITGTYAFFLCSSNFVFTYKSRNEKRYL